MPNERDPKEHPRNVHSLNGLTVAEMVNNLMSDLPEIEGLVVGIAWKQNGLMTVGWTKMPMRDMAALAAYIDADAKDTLLNHDRDG